MYILYSVFPSFSPVDDTTFSIDAVDATREAGAETATDVVVIDVSFPSDAFAGTFSRAEICFSPTYGWLGDRYEYTESGIDYSMETVTTDIDQP
jgi:hypothetical protein